MQAQKQQLDKNKDDRDKVPEYKKDSKKEISANPERQIFEIFTSLLMMVASQGETKLNKVIKKNPGYGTDNHLLHEVFRKIKVKSKL